MSSHPLVLGLLLGIGLSLIYSSFWARPEGRGHTASRSLTDRLRDDIVAAGWPNLTPPRVGILCALSGLLIGSLTHALTQAPAVALIFGAIACWLPLAMIRSRARSRRALLRDVWPDVVDHIASAIRAGMALPEALIQLGERGPDELRPAFVAFGHDYRASGKFSASLDLLKDRLSDPVGDRIVEALRIARDVGGSDLGRLLRELSGFLRDDARTRAELEARQSWTVNAARLAMAAPWLVLALLCTRAESLAAYRRPGGLVVLVIGAVVSLVAYRLMRSLGRLPAEGRVLT